MALARSLLATNHSAPGGAGGTLVTGAAGTTSGGLIVAFASLVKNNTSGDQSGLISMSNSGTALTWTYTKFGHTDPFGTTCMMATAPVVTGASTTFTFDFSGLGTFGTCMAVVQYTGQHASPFGVTGNARLGAGDIGIDGAQTLTLSGAPASTSEVIGARMCGVDTTGVCAATPGTNHTELADISEDDNEGLQVQVQDIGTASASFSWADVDSAPSAGGLDYMRGIAVEIKAATASVIQVPQNLIFQACALDQSYTW